MTKPKFTPAPTERFRKKIAGRVKNTNPSPFKAENIQLKAQIKDLQAQLKKTVSDANDKIAALQADLEEATKPAE